MNLILKLSTVPIDTNIFKRSGDTVITDENFNISNANAVHALLPGQ